MCWGVTGSDALVSDVVWLMGMEKNRDGEAPGRKASSEAPPMAPARRMTA